MKNPGAFRVALAFSAASMCALLVSRQVSTAAPKPKALSSYDAQVKELLSRMTLEEKIGQMTQADQDLR